MKRILLLIIAFQICIISITVSAFSDINNTSLSDSILNLSNFDIINGYEDGTFRPEKNITRAEFSKIICKSFLFDISPTNTEDFTDVNQSHWARDYIYTAKKLGIINGTSETTFEPESNITYEQAIKMVVAALGYNEEATSKGGYPEGYITVADELILLDDIEYSSSDYATRENIVYIIENALHAPFYFLSEVNGTVTREKSIDTLFQIHYYLTNDTFVEEETKDSVG